MAEKTFEDWQREMSESRARWLKQALEYDAPNFAAEIIFSDDDRTCQAVRRLEGKVFLLADVPKLPMPDCDADWCQCQYVMADPEDWSPDLWAREDMTTEARKSSHTALGAVLVVLFLLGAIGLGLGWF